MRNKSPPTPVEKNISSPACRCCLVYTPREPSPSRTQAAICGLSGPGTRSGTPTTVVISASLAILRKGSNRPLSGPCARPHAKVGSYPVSDSSGKTSNLAPCSAACCMKRICMARLASRSPARTTHWAATITDAIGFSRKSATLSQPLVSTQQNAKRSRPARRRIIKKPVRSP